MSQPPQASAVAIIEADYNEFEPFSGTCQIVMRGPNSLPTVARALRPGMGAAHVENFVAGFIRSARLDGLTPIVLSSVDNLLADLTRFYAP
jgi:hypothetical protein